MKTKLDEELQEYIKKADEDFNNRSREISAGELTTTMTFIFKQLGIKASLASLLEVSLCAILYENEGIEDAIEIGMKHAYKVKKESSNIKTKKQYN